MVYSSMGSINWSTLVKLERRSFLSVSADHRSTRSTTDDLVG